MQSRNFEFGEARSEVCFNRQTVIGSNRRRLLKGFTRRHKAGFLRIPDELTKVMASSVGSGDERAMLYGADRFLDEIQSGRW